MSRWRRDVDDGTVDERVLRFPKDPRFELRRVIGEGGFGVVYDTFDRRWGIRVALKLLRSADDHRVVRFKKEFRSLADVRHPNLVKLHELYVDSSCAYFTMDLVDGIDLRSAFRPQYVESQSATAGVNTAPHGTLEPVGTHALAPLAPSEARRFASALLELALALQHLHEAGWVHRDIKPSNVLLTEDGRVMLVDFGLVDQLGISEATDVWSGTVPGTPGYVAPEQLHGDTVDAAADCWAIGVLMAEILIGGASQRDVLSALEEAREPILRDILEIAARLLEPAPQTRATVQDLIRALSAITGTEIAPAIASKRLDRIPFVGRHRERAELAAAFAALDRGESTWVRVRGAPGIGKTALVAQACHDAGERSDRWILTTTCRDREFIAFRGIDALMDQLGAAIRRDAEIREVVTARREVALVGATFPALAPHSAKRIAAETDGLDARRRTFNAWRDLLATVAERRQLVFVIDDAHWGDADSGLLLSFLVERPIRALIIIIERSDGEATSLSSNLEHALARHERSWIDVELAPMTAEDARLLLERCVNDISTARARIESMVVAALGIPLFLVTIAFADGADGATWNFNDSIADRLRSLPRAAAAVLEAASLSSIPLRDEILFSALASVPGTPEALIELDLLRLVRRVPRDGTCTIEPFHDRVRQAVLGAAAPSAVAQRHRELATAFREHYGEEERPDVLFVHYAGAGENELASVYGERAAAKAREALAFDRASSLYREAAQLTSDTSRCHRLLELAGDSLLSAGRTKEAAMFFEDLAFRPGVARVAAIQRKAAEAYLVTGHHEEGFRIWRTAVLEMGLGFPETPAAAARGAARALVRARLPWLPTWRGRISKADSAARAEAALAAAKGLIATNPMHGVFFGAESLLHARSAGAPEGLVTSLSFVAAACLAAAGGVWRRWAIALLDEAQDYADAETNIQLRANVTIMRAQIALFQGRWSEAADRALEGLLSLNSNGYSRAWEANMARLARVRSLEELGAFDALVTEAEEWRLLAEERDDAYGVVTAHLTLGIGSLATASADAAEWHARQADERWRGSGYSVQRFYADRIRVLAALQRGDLDWAVRLLRRVSRDVRGSMIFKIPTGRVDTLWMESRVALGRIRVGGSREALVRLLGRHARTLAAEEHLPAQAHAAFIRARLSALEDGNHADHAEARALYAKAAMAPMVHLLDACRGGDATTRAIAELKTLGVADPVAWSRGHGIDICGLLELR